MPSHVNHFPLLNIGVRQAIKAWEGAAGDASNTMIEKEVDLKTSSPIARSANLVQKAGVMEKNEKGPLGSSEGSITSSSSRTPGRLASSSPTRMTRLQAKLGVTITGAKMAKGIPHSTASGMSC